MLVSPYSQNDKLSGQPYSPETKPNPGWEWYDPPQESPPIRFCLDTGLHGLRYVGQTKRHICERILWLIACTAAVTTAVLIIAHMWISFKNMPIITVFTPSDKKIDEIPFPAITVCNVNTLQKSKHKEVVRKANEYIESKENDRELLELFADLLDTYHICNSTPSFFDRFVQPTTDDLDKIIPEMMKREGEYEQYLDPVRTLRSLAQPCHQMIPLCIWRDTITNCTELFKEVETDFGHCCTFNMIPVKLLLRDEYENDVNEDEEPTRIKSWKKLNITTDNLIFTEETDKRKYPDRQRFAGRSAGLSFLLNPELDEYFCTNTDSEGFVVGVHLPLDYPRMKDNGIAVPANSEVFLSLRPEITLADSATKRFPLKKRECYFSHEYELGHYTKYTTSNCIADCITNKTSTTCGCLRYYMPHKKDKTKLCRPNNYSCTDQVKVEIVSKGLDTTCRKCLQTCNNIVYHTEVTNLPLRDKKVQDLFRNYTQLQGAKKLSVVHVYFNVESTYPRIRKEMTTLIELISNAGGILGLCMGFSMLSLLEIVYHATIRQLFNAYRQKSKPQDQEDLSVCHVVLKEDAQNDFLVKALHYASPQSID